MDKNLIKLSEEELMLKVQSCKSKKHWKMIAYVFQK